MFLLISHQLAYVYISKLIGDYEFVMVPVTLHHHTIRVLPSLGTEADQGRAVGMKAKRNRGPRILA